MADAPARKLWLDWQRGLAVLYMIEWHTWDSWRADAVASGAVHDALAIIGGFAAPSFLYMAGMSQLLGDAAQERKGVSVADRRDGVLRRGLWLLGVAYLLRLFWYVVGGAFLVPGGWQGLLRVDVLNVIAVSLLAAATFTIGKKARTQVLLAAAAAAGVALLTPVVAGWQHAPSRVLDYLYADPPRAIFHLFPWAAFCFAGAALGRLAMGPQRPFTWIAIGVALAGAGWLGDQLPPFYAHQDFWRTSPSWVAIRLGGVVITSGLLQLVPARADRWLAWLRTLGRHSLLGYFLSIELPYGVLSHPLHKRLGTASGVVGFVAMTVLIWAVSEAMDRRDARKAQRARAAAGARSTAARPTREALPVSRILLAAVAVAVLAAAVVAALPGPRPRSVLQPAPLVSRGRPVFSSPPGAAPVVDGRYRDGASWAGGRPSEAQPSWVAIDVGEGPTRVLVAWTSSGNHDYTDRRYGAPVDYRIETSSNSTNGADGSWRTALSIHGNPARTRAHAIDFAGDRWVRLVVTGLSPDVFEYGLFIDEVDVHDLSEGGDDIWVFFGDSITSAVFDRAPARQPSFPEAVARRHPGFFPAMIGAGFGSLHHDGAVKRIDEVLELNPDARVVAILVGSNDWDPVAYRADLLAIVRKVKAAGAIPVVARIPFRSDSREDFAARLDAVVDEVTAQEGLVPGPDLHGWFKAHPERLTDGLHPDDAGAIEVIRRWAEAAAPLYR